MIALIARAAAWLPRLLPAAGALAPVAGRVMGKISTPLMIGVIIASAGAWHWWVVSGLERDLTAALERAATAEYNEGLLRSELEGQNAEVEALAAGCAQKDKAATVRALRELDAPRPAAPHTVEGLNDLWTGGR